MHQKIEGAFDIEKVLRYLKLAAFRDSDARALRLVCYYILLLCNEKTTILFTPLFLFSHQNYIVD